MSDNNNTPVCSSCGHVLDYTAKKCMNCGADIQSIHGCLGCACFLVCVGAATGLIFILGDHTSSTLLPIGIVAGIVSAVVIPLKFTHKKRR